MILLWWYPACNTSGYEIREAALYLFYDSLHKQGKEVCQEILRTLLDKPEIKVIRVTPQSVITSLHREIILDVLCVMENGAYMNIEMQKGSGNDDIKRNRFYASSTTTAYTPKGTASTVFANRCVSGDKIPGIKQSSKVFQRDRRRFWRNVQNGRGLCEKLCERLC